MNPAESEQQWQFEDVVNLPENPISPQEQGIALLMEMAQRGEIDPWDVQVIEVIDRVLAQLEQNCDRASEADLSQSGQTFLYASMLVWLKANRLDPLSVEEESETLIDSATDVSEATEPTQRRVVKLENHIRRRAIAKPLKQRRVTLQELIAQIRLMSATMTEQLEKRPRRRPALNRSQTARAIAQLAHEENLSEIAGELEQFFTQQGQHLFGSSPWLDLDQLLIAQPKNDRVGVFWALLLLSAQSKVELAQEEFYQDLKIRSLI